LDHSRRLTHRERAFFCLPPARIGRTATVQKRCNASAARSRTRARAQLLSGLEVGTEFANRCAVQGAFAMDSTVDALTGHAPLSVALRATPLSIQEIIRRHHGALIKFLRRRLSIAEDAEDVAQETYIRMMRYEGSSELNSPSAMLFRIAVNVANDHGRAAVARRSNRHTKIDDIELTSDLPSVEREILASQTLDLLLETIEQLPPKCRQVFLLSRASDMTYPEIAAHCGISVKMVEKHISRAIAACLEKVGSSV